MLKLISVLLVATVGSRGQSSYCGLSPQHTLCLHRKGETGPSCGAVNTRGVSMTEMDTIVDTHNRLRSSVAQGTTGLVNDIIIQNSSILYCYNGKIVNNTMLQVAPSQLLQT